MKAILVSLILGTIFSAECLADRITLDTGNDFEGMVKEQGDNVRLEYISHQGKEYQLRVIEIPRSRIKKIEYDPSYFRRYQQVIRGLGGVSVASPSAGGKGSDSLSEAIRQGNMQLQKNLQQEKERMSHAKFYWGWHEGYHWDPNNGWHRWNHQGLYDPFDPNITARDRQ